MSKFAKPHLNPAVRMNLLSFEFAKASPSLLCQQTFIKVAMLGTPTSFTILVKIITIEVRKPLILAIANAQTC